MIVFLPLSMTAMWWRNTLVMVLVVASPLGPPGQTKPLHDLEWASQILVVNLMLQQQLTSCPVQQSLVVIQEGTATNQGAFPFTAERDLRMKSLNFDWQSPTSIKLQFLSSCLYCDNSHSANVVSLSKIKQNHHFTSA